MEFYGFAKDMAVGMAHLGNAWPKRRKNTGCQIVRLR
jgi:hypothetical protein